MSTDRTRRGDAAHDDGLDLAQLAADDAALDRLRAGLRGRSALAEQDVALRLVQDLLRDVTLDLPAGRRAAEPLSLRRSERRLARSGAVVATLAAGLLSLGGAAAAATLAPEGSALWGVGEAVRTATGAVVAVVTPSSTPGAPGESPHDVAAPGPDRPRPGPSSGPAGTPPGAVAGPTSVAARSAAAAHAVTVQLDAAERHLAVGRPVPARRSLEAAARRLPDVRAEDGAAALAQRLGALQARAERDPEQEQDPDRRPADQQPRPAPAAGIEPGPPPASRQQSKAPAGPAAPELPAPPRAPAPPAAPPRAGAGPAAPAAEHGPAATQRPVEPGGAQPARAGTGDAPAPER